jgi:hypothetical protein
MDQPIKPRNATVRLDDLRALTELGLLRLPSADAEARRTAHMRTVVAAASELDRALASQIRCMLVNCQGSRGAGDLARETDALYAALLQYTELVHDVGRDRERIMTGAAPEVMKDQDASEPRIASSARRPALRRAV